MIEAKKSLGQNFFTNPNLAKRIVETVLSESTDIIVEIGPGQGFFSNLFKVIGENYLKNIIMIEKDDFLAFNLAELFPNNIVVNKDFLDWNFEELRQHSTEKITFFGSLPYNVSKKIIEKIIHSEYFKTDAYFIVQKEVAEKYTAKLPQNNLLATRTAIYAEVKKILDITPESFRPRPKVMSSLIRLSPIKRQYDFLINETTKIRFDRFLQNAYKQPRKKLSNNLKAYTFKENSKILKVLENRPQHISLEEYILLFRNISKD